MRRLTIYTDGGARGNPGPAGIGAVVLDEEGTVVVEISEYIGEQTNNAAEYTALIRALEACKQRFGSALRDMAIEVRMDSELVVRQLTGIYKVKEPALQKKFAEIAALRLEDVPNIVFTHVYRDQNKRADELVNRAIDAART